MNEENTVISSREEHCLQTLLTQVSIRIYVTRTFDPVLAGASTNLNSCFTIRDLKAVDVGNGPFISTPGYRAGGGYRDAYFPSEGEFRQQSRQVVLDACEQALYRLPRRRQEYQTEPTQNNGSM